MDPPKSARGLLLLAAAVVLIAWQLPYGEQALYPLTLLATYAHELGHGLTALVLGGSFESLVMYADGSGLAAWQGDLGRIAQALVAAGGLVGPSVAGSALLIATRDARRGRWLLLAIGVFMLATMLLFVRNAFGFVFVGAMGLAALLSARLLSASAATFVVQLIGVVLCLAVFKDLDYMFSAGAMVGGELRPSDSSAIARALLLPYWVWGGVVAATSFFVLFWGLRVALRPHPPLDANQRIR